MTDDAEDSRQPPIHGSARQSDAISPFDEQLDEIAQARFNRTDTRRSELVAR